ncbi:Holliday junction branch migration protein RuvA [Halopseudomonas pelagia]|uniref:Holliday junction branch migration complex subunit RuvA n=1 Tax=Halopseudomonas pelagia TaxID=553151 RepID=A0AA91U3V4_9GAMM|nr:Holliday junction branch migration protein RuvA [Halopseudomonas pelagia]PCC99906.1 Holliday junction branch migration protein RuvA [Halopseudomonas pelagia]QFY56232.1 Holliday junction branch migration protein RuvA [Halopseudomonas pelagia]
MIGRLKGILLEKQPPHILLDVQGVGYELDAPMSTFYKLPTLGEMVTLHTHMVVREDAQLLYAFAEKRERELFRELIRLNGVGPKLALALMSGLEVDELIRAVQAQDTSALVRVPGVGKKTAERLLIELRDRFKAWETLPGSFKPLASGAAAAAPASHSADAVSALISLGYKPQEASRAIASVEEDGLSSEELIRRALKGIV